MGICMFYELPPLILRTVNYDGYTPSYEVYAHEGYIHRTVFGTLIQLVTTSFKTCSKPLD